MRFQPKSNLQTTSQCQISKMLDIRYKIYMYNMKYVLPSSIDVVVHIEYTGVRFICFTVGKSKTIAIGNTK